MILYPHYKVWGYLEITLSVLSLVCPHTLLAHLNFLIDFNETLHEYKAQFVNMHTERKLISAFPRVDNSP